MTPTNPSSSTPSPAAVTAPVAQPFFTKAKTTLAARWDATVLTVQTAYKGSLLERVVNAVANFFASTYQTAKTATCSLCTRVSQNIPYFKKDSTAPPVEPKKEDSPVLVPAQAVQQPVEQVGIFTRLTSYFW